MSTSLDDEIHALVVHDPGTDLAAAVRRHAVAVAPLLATTELDGLVARVLARVGGLGPLDPLLP